jgi:hypothetical protein
VASERTATAESDARIWRRFVLTFIAVFAGGLGLIYAFILFVDPYDTGRFPALRTAGTYDENKLTASAGRARDPRFDAAIFGNSRGQLIDPWRLSQATGLSFVQLTTAGSGPREQLTMMRWFLRHHPHPAALVLQIDERWCSSDPSLPVTYPFPFWLYRGNAEYLTHLLSTRSLRAAVKRIRFALGRVPAQDLRGAWDYEANRVWSFRPEIPPDGGARGSDAIRIDGGDGRGGAADPSLPALDRLKALIAAEAPHTPIVVVVPPVFYTALPPAGTSDAAALDRCRQAFRGWLADRPPSGWSDFMVDLPLFRDPHNFMDMVHYRSNVARGVEAAVAGELRGQE